MIIMSLWVYYHDSVGNTRINTVCLPFDVKPGETHENDLVTVAGWGATKNLLGQGIMISLE